MSLGNDLTTCLSRVFYIVSGYECDPRPVYGVDWSERPKDHREYRRSSAREIRR